MEHKTVLLVLLLVALANAGPLTRRHGSGCAKSCPTSDGTAPSPYTPGRSYTFNYLTGVRSEIKGASEESTGLRLTAKIVLDVFSPCELAMRMEEVRVSEQDPAQRSRWTESPHQAQFESELMTSDIHFVMRNGAIPEVCAEMHEPDWVLNIKKAIIGLLQNTNPNKLESYNGVETDISGKCEVAYSPATETGRELEVVKVTNLMSCLDQQRVRSSFQSTSYRVPAQIQSMPLTKANRTCRTVYYASGNLKSAQCNEEHIFRPFSTESAGAMTQIEQKIEFIGSGGMPRLSHDHTFKRSPLEYQHHDYKLHSRTPLEDVKSVLNELCELGSAVTPKTPKLFNELIHRLRVLSADQLSSIRDDVEGSTVCRRNGQMARQFFFDALPVVSTPAATEMMKELVLNGRISSTVSDMWLTSLAFVQDPQKAMLENLAPLLEAESPSQQAQLGIGALVHQYCKSRSECSKDLTVKRIGEALRKLLGADCSTGVRKSVLATLKAIGNAGYLTDLMPTLVRCVNREANLMEVRIAAIEALRRTPCSEDRTPLMKLIRSKDVDSELRITAYLGLMSCPTIELFDTVKELLTAESSNQFASFMWTHLTNLLETSDPHKQDIRLIVEDVKLKKQYDLDKLKFSRNVEKSFFSKYLNAGAKLESNLIWSQRSFLPRSATLNMTLDLFGKSFNFFEVGGRVQGLETLLEKYLGPKGMERKQQTDTNSQLAELDNTFKVIEDEIGGSLDIKIFGHQIAFVDLWRENLERSGGNFLEWLNTLKQLREVNWQKSFAFLDTQVTIPTISGFPLILAANGTASFVIKSSGGVDVRKLMQWPPKVEIEGKLSPSGTVHLSGMLGIGTIFGDYGVKMTANIHSSTEMQAKIKTANGEELQVEFQQPRDRQNILNTKTSFFVIHRSVEREQKMRQDLLVRRKACSQGKLMENILGLELCAEINYPTIVPQDGAPLAPIAAGVEMDLSMFKRDSHTSYQLHVINRKEGTNRHWKVLIDTPGSRADRKLQTEFVLDSINKRMEATLSTPWKKGKFLMSMNSVGSTKQLVFSTEVDGTVYTSATANYKRIETVEEVKHELENMELLLLNFEPVVFKGKLISGKVADQVKLAMEFSAENILTRPIAVSASVVRTADRATAVANLNSPFFVGKLDTDYSLTVDGISGMTSVTYKVGERSEETVQIEPTIKFSASTGEHNLKGSFKCVLSEFPHYNAHVAVISKRSSHYNHEMDIIFEFGNGGEFVRVKKNYELIQRGGNHEHTLTASVATKTARYTMQKEVVHDPSWTNLRTKLMLKDDKTADRMLSTRMEFSREAGTIFYTASLKAQVTDESYTIVSKLQRQSTSYKFETSVTLLDVEHSMTFELQRQASKYMTKGLLSLADVTRIETELKLDTSSSEPSISAILASPRGTYSANASANFRYEDITILGQLVAPDVDLKARLFVDKEVDNNRLAAELYWNPRRDESDGFKLDGYLKVNRMAHSLERDGKLVINYPTGTLEINIKENNEHLKSNKYIEMVYGSGKKVSANFMYDINDGWTEKGIISMLKLVTPFPRYEDITLKLDGYGSLRVRQLKIESVINGRRFKADILINLGNINNFHSRLSIVTPWAQASFIKFELTHWLTSSEIKTKLDVDFKTKNMIFEVQGRNKGSYSRGRDVGFKIESTSTFDWMPKLLMDINHKDDGKQFSSHADLTWNDDKTVSLKSNFNFFPQSNNKLESRGNISLSTPFSGYETFSLTWNHKNNNQMVSSICQVTYLPGKTVEVVLSAYDELTAHRDRQMGGSFSAVVPFMEKLSLKGTAKSGSSKLESIVQLKVPYVGDYQVDAVATTTGPRFHIKFDTPHQKLAKFGLAHSSRRDSDNEESSNSEIYWNEEGIKLTTKSLPSPSNQMFEVILQTPFDVVKHERLQVLSSTEEGRKMTIEFSHNLQKLIGASVSKKLNSDGREYKFSLETPLRRLQSLEASFQYAWMESEKYAKTSVTYNREHSFNLEASTIGTGTQYSFSGKISTQCTAGSKKLIWTLDSTPQNKTIQLTIDAGLDKPIFVKSLVEYRGIFEIEATTPFAAFSFSKVHASVGKISDVYKSDLVIQHVCNREMQKFELTGELSGVRNAKLQVLLATPAFLVSDLKVTLDHKLTDTGKWTTVAGATFEGGRIDISSELSLDSGDFNWQWSLRTPFMGLEGLNMAVRHRNAGRLIEHQHEYKMIAAGNSVKIINSLRLLGLRDIRISSQFTSNIRGIESVLISGHQTVENSLMSYDGALNIEHGHTTIAAGVDWKLRNSRFEGSSFFKLPVDALKSFNATVRTSIEDWTHWTTKVKINMENSMGMVQFENDFSLSGLEDASATIKLRSPITNVAGNLQVETMRGRAVLIQGLLNVDDKENQVTIKMEKVSDSHYKARFQVTGQPVIVMENKWQSSTDNFNGLFNVKFDDWEAVAGETRLLRTSEKISLVFNTKVFGYLQNSSVEVVSSTGRFSFNLNHNCDWFDRPIQVKLDAVKDDSRLFGLSTNALLKTPFFDDASGTLVISLENIFKGKTLLDIRLPSTDNVKANASWNFLTDFKANVQLSLPYIQGLTAKLVTDNEELVLSVEMPKFFSEKWELRVGGSIQSMTKGRLTFKLQTSLSNLRKINIRHSHNFEDDSHLNTIVEIPGWSKSLQIEFRNSASKSSLLLDGPGVRPFTAELFTVRELGSFEAKLSANWDPLFGSHDLEVRTKLSQHPSYKILLDIKLPLEVFNIDALNTKVEGEFRRLPTTAFDAEVHFSRGLGEPLAELFKTSYGKQSDKRVFTVTLPTLEMSASASHGNAQTLVVFTAEGKRMELKQKSTFNSLADFEIEGSLKSSGHTMKELHIRHQGHLSQFKNSATLKIDLTPIFEYSGQVNSLNGGMKAEFEFETPITEKMTLRLGHDGNLYDFSHYLDVRSKYHAPLNYRGQFRNLEGDFTASVPVLGESSMRIRQDGRKRIVSLSASNNRKLTLELDNEWTGITGRSTLKVNVMDQTATISLKNEGEGWKKFMTELTAQAAGVLFETTVGFEAKKSVQLSAQYTQLTDSTQPRNSFTLTANRDQKNFLADVQLVNNGKILFGLSAKHEFLKTFSVVLQTSRGGIRETSIVGSLADSFASLEFNNDLTQRNTIKFEVVDRSTAKVVFDSEILGIYSIQYKSPNMENSRFTVSAHPEIEVRWPDSDPIVLRVVYQTTSKSFDVAVNLLTPFSHFTDNKLILSGASTAEVKQLSAKVSQDYFGNHGFSLRANTKTRNLSGDITLESEFEAAVSKITWTLTPQVQEISVQNSILGPVKYNGKTENVNGDWTGSYTLEAPHHAIGVTSVAFEWLSTNQQTKLSMKLKNPLLGENNLELNGQSTVVGTDTKTTVKAALYIEKLDEKLNVQSTFTSGQNSTLYKAMGSYSFTCNRLGSYSLIEEVTFESGRIHTSITVHTPFNSWDRTGFSLEVDAKQKLHIGAHLETRKYGVQSLELRVRDNDLTAAATFMSERHELNIAGWNAEATDSGSAWDFVASVNSPSMKASTHLALKKGHFSVEASTTGSFAITSAVKVGASWELKPARVLLDLNANLHVDDFDQTWGATCDIDLADQNSKRVVFKLEAPWSRIEKTEVSVRIQMHPMVDATLTLQSPCTGSMKIKTMWQSTEEIFSAPTTGKFAFESSFKQVPSFEVVFGNVQRHENLITDISVRLINANKLLFKAGSVYDAYNKKLVVSVGTSQVGSLVWHSRSDFSNKVIDEKVSILLDQEEKFSADAKLSWRREEKTVAFKITTPFSGYERFGFKLVGLVTSIPFHWEAQVLLPAQELKTTAIFDLTDGLHVRGALMLPNLPQMELAFQAAGNLRRYKFEVTTQYGMSRFSGLAHWSIIDELMARLKLETPASNLRLLDVYSKATSDDLKSELDIGFAFNDYSNSVKLSKTSNSKGLQLRMHLLGKLYEVELKRLGHEENRAVNFFYKVNNEIQVEITARLTSMFTDKSWNIRPPHSGFIEVKRLFGYDKMENVVAEWDFSGVDFKDAIMMFRLEQSDVRIWHRMSIREGHFSFKTSFHLPVMDIKFEDVSGSVTISKPTKHAMQLDVELSTQTDSFNLIGSTNWLTSATLRISGLNNFKFVKQGSLNFQVHRIITERLSEISVKVAGLARGDLATVVSLKSEKTLKQLTIGANFFGNQIDVNLDSKYHRGWLSSAVDQELVARAQLFTAAGAKHSVSWVSKINPSKLEADLQVASSILSDDQPLGAKLVAIYQNELHTTLDLSALGTHLQTQIKMGRRQLDLLLKLNGEEVVNVIASCSKTGYKTQSFSQRLHVLYRKQVIFSSETQQEISSWRRQFGGSVDVQLFSQRSVAKMSFNAEVKLFSVEIDINSDKPMKMTVDFRTITNPKIRIVYGTNEVAAHIEHVQVDDNTFKTKLGIDNPWQPISVKLHHEHREGRHRVKHEYNIGDRHYKLNSHVLKGQNTFDASLHYQSPARELQMNAAIVIGEAHGSLVHTFLYNGRNYMDLKAKFEHKGSNNKDFARQTDAKVDVVTPFMEPTSAELQYHYNTNWRDSMWRCKFTHGDLAATHTGLIQLSNGDFSSTFNLLDYETEMKIGNGHYTIRQKSGSTNIGHLTGTYSHRSSSLNFNSDLIGFHTDARLRHQISRDEGSVTFEQKGSHQLPGIGGSWKVDGKSFRAELSVGESRFSTEHIHNSLKDFNCRYTVNHGGSKHEFKAGFAVRPSSRSEYHTEIDGHAILESAVIPTFGLKFQHLHNSWKDHSCSAKVVAAGWKVLHKTTARSDSRIMSAETTVHRDETSLFRHMISINSGQYSAEASVGEIIMYKLLGQCTPKSTQINLVSDHFEIDSTTKIEHNLRNWREGTFSISHNGGPLPRIEVNSNWDLVGESRRVHLKWNRMEVDLNGRLIDGRIHFRHQIDFGLEKLSSSGVYDPTVFYRLTEVNLRASSHWSGPIVFTWDHRINWRGQVRVALGQSETTKEVSSSWDFTSPQRTLKIVHSTFGKLEFAQETETSGKITVVANLPEGTRNMTGVLNASPTWKSGALRLQNGESVLNGLWNIEGSEKNLTVEAGTFQLKLHHNHRNRHDFSFNHQIVCESCLLSIVLPASLNIQGVVTAETNLATGRVSGSVAMNKNSPINVRSRWNLVGEQKLIEIVTPLSYLRLEHQHRSFKDFSFRHSLAILTQTHTVTGNFKIENGQHAKANFHGFGYKLGFSHRMNDQKRHDWRHEIQAGEWQINAEGHLLRGASMQSGIIVRRAAEQMLTKNFSWSPEKLEYEDSAWGVKYHHLKFVNSPGEKAAWFKSNYYHKIVGAGASMKRTCPTCYQLEMRAATVNSPNLLKVDAEVQVTDRSLVVKGNFEIPSGKMMIDKKLEGVLKSFEYSATLRTESGKLETGVEVRLEAINNLVLKARLDHSDLLTILPNHKAKFEFTQSGDSWRRLQQTLDMSINDWQPLAYNGKIAVTSATQWICEMKLIEKMTPMRNLAFKVELDKELSAAVSWMDTSFVQVKVNNSYSLVVKSSCPVLPHLSISVQPHLQPNKASIDAEIRYAEKVVQGKLAIDSGAHKMLKVELMTPSTTFSKISTVMSVTDRLSGRFAAQAVFEVNDMRYSTSLNVEKESASASVPRGVLGWKAETPHSGFRKLQILVQHRDHSGRLVASINDNEISLACNATSESLSLRASLPIAGFEKVGLKIFADEEESRPRLRILVKLPYNQFVKITAAGNMRYEGLRSLVNGSVQIETSLSAMRNAKIEVGHALHDGRLQHSSSIVIDDQRWHRMSINSSQEQGVIRMEFQHPVRIDYRLSLGEVNFVELKITYKDTVPFHLNAQVSKTDYSLSGKSFLTLRTPYRTVALNREVKISPRGFTLKVEFTPNQQTTAPLVMTIHSLNKSDYLKKAASVTVALTLPTRRLETTIDMEKSRDEAQLSASLNWDAAKSSSDKILRFKISGIFMPDKKLAGRLELQVANKKPYSIAFATSLRERQVLFSNRLEMDITDNRQDTIVLELRGTRVSLKNIQISGRLFQDSGKVNLKVEGQLKRTEAQKEGSLSLEYVGSDGQSKRMNAALRLSSNTVRVDMTSPTRQCNFELTRDVQPEVTKYTLTTHGKSFELLIRTTKPDFEFVYQPRQNDRVSAAIGYPNSRHLRIDIHRTTDQVKMQHLLAEVQMKSRHLMRTRVHWNPTYALLHYSTLRDRLPSMYAEVSGFVHSLRFTCVRDLLNKLRTDLVLPDLSSVAEFANEELRSLRLDFGYMSSQFEQMYSHNEFYSRDILRFVRKTAAAIGFYTGAAARYGYARTSQVYREHVHPHARRAVLSALYYGTVLHRIAREHYSNCRDGVQYAYGVYRRHADRVHASLNRNTLHYLNAAVENIRPALDAAHSGLQATLNAYSNFHRKVVGHPVVQQLHRRVAESINNINYQSFGQLHTQLHSAVVSAHQSIESRLGELTEHTASVVDGAQYRMRQGLNDIMENRHAQLASSFVTGAYEQSKWFLDNFNIEQNLKDFAKDNYLQAVEYLRQNSIGLATDYLGLSKNEIIEQDLQQGRFEAQVYSPMAWNDLQSWPSSGLEDVHSRLSASYNSMRHSVDTFHRKLTAVRDVVTDAIPDFDMPSGSWIPKFKGVASVVGEHIITFDGRYYDFRGSECTYLLARDFRGHGWAMTMSYGRSGKSLDIYAYGKRITVSPRLHVFVDGAQQELPLSIGNLSIVRTASGLHAKDLGHLFTVFVDPGADSHTISVSGWYHGRLAGLLGNFDNEAFNDLIDSTGLRVEDVLRFTQSWRLGRCRHTNLASRSTGSEARDPECLSLFKSTWSPFQHCFSRVNPAIFLDICDKESGPRSQHTCRAAKLYIQYCAAMGLKGLRPPTQCMRCDVRSSAGFRQLLAGQRERISSTGTAADVVLVLEERGCLGRDTLRRLPELAAQLQRSLNEAGVTDVRFGLLGFGNPAHHRRGSSGRSHWHTMAGELTGNAEQLAGALANVDVHNTVDSGAEVRSDALDAVRLASRFSELRPHAARHVILVACDECHEGRWTLQSVRRALDESGVRLHLLSELRLPTFAYGRRSQAFGIDAGRAFSVEAPEGSAALHGFTRLPAGKCARLASSTGGAAFDLRYLRRRQYNGQAALFARSFADRVARDSARPSAQDCQCGASACGQSARLRCRLTSNGR